MTPKNPVAVPPRDGYGARENTSQGSAGRAGSRSPIREPAPRTPAGAGIPSHAGEAGAAPAPAGLRGAEWRRAVRDAQAGKRRKTPATKRPALPVPVSGATLTATARCGGCEWTEGPGTAAAVDKAADKHVSVGHPTATIAEPGSAA